MYQKVLFPTDFSVHSQQVLERIGEIPGIREVVLLHVVDATSAQKKGAGPGTETEAVTSLLAQNKKVIVDLGLTVQSHIDVTEKTAHQGTIGSRILEMAEREKVSLIVMGARGKSLHDLFLGSVSTYVLHHATVPLLLVKSPQPDSTGERATPPATRSLFAKILIPTDFSAPAGEALRFVKGTEGIDEIILLNVVHAEKNDSGLPELIKSATMNIGLTRDELARSGFTVKEHVRVGYPPDEINLLAGQEQATLIAMSPLGEGWLRGLKELFVGSTTYAVVRRADRPVLVIRPINRA